MRFLGSVFREDAGLKNTSLKYLVDRKCKRNNNNDNKNEKLSLAGCVVSQR